MTDIEFSLDCEHVELHHLLKLTGVCVTVDGVIELRKTCKIRSGQTVRIEDITIRVIAAGQFNATAEPE